MYGDFKGTTHSSFKIGASATPGHVLTADEAGVGTWQAPAGGDGATLYSHEFVYADLTAGVLTVAHNLGIKVVPVVVANNDDMVIIPDDLTFTDTSNLSLDLSSYGEITGTWTVTVGVGAGAVDAVLSRSFMIGNPDSDADGPVWRVPVGITITKVSALVIGAAGENVVGSLYEYDADGGAGAVVQTSYMTATVGTTANATDFSNASIAQWNWIGWVTQSVNGEPTRIIVTYDFIIT